MLLTACSESQLEVHDNQFVFGTIVKVTLMGDQHMQHKAALQAIRQDLAFMDKAWNPWVRGPTGRTNELLATGSWFSMNPSVRPLFIKSKRFSISSGGLFNPGIAALVKLWGFHTDQPHTAPPAQQDIDALLKKIPDLHNLEFDGIRMRDKTGHIQFDFGAIAKGQAVETVMAYLKDFGIYNAMINAGGDIKVIGKHGKRRWNIGIRDPRKKQQALAGINLNSHESIFTSGNYERYFDYNGKRYHHIIDPRSGYPATGTTSVTVISKDAALADAAATALFIAGPNNWHRLAQAMGIKYVMFIDDNGVISMNPAMQQRLQLRDKNAIVKISAALI